MSLRGRRLGRVGRGICMMCGVRDGRKRCDVLGFEGFWVGNGGVEMVGLILLLTMLFYFKKTIQGSL